MLEAVDATHYASADTWVALGFGGPPDVPDLADRVKTRALVFIDAVEMMAEALNVKLDDIVFRAEFATATEDLALGYMDIAKGTVCGLKMTYSGMIGTSSLIDLSLMWRLVYAMTPDWKPEGYVVHIDGEPSVRCTYELTETVPTSGGLATAMAAVNAIPAVCAARAGIVKAGELPLIVATGRVRRI